MVLSTKHNQINNSLFHITILDRTNNSMIFIYKKILLVKHHKLMLLLLQIKRVAIIKVQDQHRSEVYFQNSKLNFLINQLIVIIQIKGVKYLIRKIKLINSIIINKNKILNFHPIHFSVVQHKLQNIWVNQDLHMQQDLILAKKVIKILQILI